MEIIYLIVLRLVHVVSGVSWVGAGFVTFLFVGPTARDLQPAGMQFLAHMAGKRRFNNYMVINSTLTVLSGALLIGASTGGDLGSYVKTGPGLGFALGSVAGVIVYFVGMFGIGRPTARMAQIGEQIEKAGGPPTPEQMAEMQKLEKSIAFYHKVDFGLVALSLVLMGTARYWLF